MCFAKSLIATHRRECSRAGSNRRPLAHKTNALTTALQELVDDTLRKNNRIRNMSVIIVKRARFKISPYLKVISTRYSPNRAPSISKKRWRQTHVHLGAHTSEYFFVHCLGNIGISFLNQFHLFSYWIPGLQILLGLHCDLYIVPHSFTVICFSPKHCYVVPFQNPISLLIKSCMNLVFMLVLPFFSVMIFTVSKLNLQLTIYPCKHIH